MLLKCFATCRDNDLRLQLPQAFTMAAENSQEVLEASAPFKSPRVSDDLLIGENKASVHRSAGNWSSVRGDRRARSWYDLIQQKAKKAICGGHRPSAKFQYDPQLELTKRRHRQREQVLQSDWGPTSSTTCRGLPYWIRIWSPCLWSS